MNFYYLFAATEFRLKELTIDDITMLTSFFMGAILIAGIGILLWRLIPEIISNHHTKRSEDAKEAVNVWFDETESVLHRGPQSLKIPENTIEFYVCQMIFEERDKYQKDLYILEEAGSDISKGRAVYQAVTRLNKKAKIELGIEELFIRGKEKTGLSKIYR